MKRISESIGRKLVWKFIFIAEYHPPDQRERSWWHKLLNVYILHWISILCRCVVVYLTSELLTPSPTNQWQASTACLPTNHRAYSFLSLALRSCKTQKEQIEDEFCEVNMRSLMDLFKYNVMTLNNINMIRGDDQETILYTVVFNISK